MLRIGGGVSSFYTRRDYGGLEIVCMNKLKILAMCLKKQQVTTVYNNRITILTLYKIKLDQVPNKSVHQLSIYQSLYIALIVTLFVGVLIINCVTVTE